MKSLLINPDREKEPNTSLYIIIGFILSTRIMLPPGINLPFY